MVIQWRNEMRELINVTFVLILILIGVMNKAHSKEFNCVSPSLVMAPDLESGITLVQI